MKRSFICAITGAPCEDGRCTRDYCVAEVVLAFEKARKAREAKAKDEAHRQWLIDLGIISPDEK